jgi:hypothetical protein
VSQSTEVWPSDFVPKSMLIVPTFNCDPTAGYSRVPFLRSSLAISLATLLSLLEIVEKSLLEEHGFLQFGNNAFRFLRLGPHLSLLHL